MAYCSNVSLYCLIGDVTFLLFWFISYFIGLIFTMILGNLFSCFLRCARVDVESRRSVVDIDTALRIGHYKKRPSIPDKFYVPPTFLLNN
jgi:hypothetical protein